MNSKRKIIATILIVIMLCATCCIMSACPKQEKEKKYDVTIKIVCQEVVNGYTTGDILGEWVFTPDIDEMTIEREYDGKQYTYYLYRYNLPEHPRWSDDWFSPSFEGANAFHGSFEKYTDGKLEPVRYVCEKGEYWYNTYVRTSSFLAFRSIYLTIIVV